MIGFLFGIAFGGVLLRVFAAYRYRPIVMQSDRWLKISDHPIHPDEKDFFVSDGKRVYYLYTPRYDNLGRVVASYNNFVVTHWLPQPLPPTDD